MSEEGVTLVLRPGDRYDEIASNSLDGVFKASMAVSQGSFYLRSSEHLYRIDAPSIPEPK